MKTETDDPRLALIYQEALRGLMQQQTAMESLRSRAATLIFATSFATSLFSAQALSNGFGVWDWVAIGLLLGVSGLTTVLLWPYYNLTFRFDAEDLLKTYIDTDAPATLADMHRRMALHIKQDWHANGRVMRRLRVAFELALVFLLLEIIAWMFSIATSL